MEVIAKGLEEFGVLPGSADESLQPDAGFHRRWTVHSTGHMLGIDVHDCAQARKECYYEGLLEEGMVLTVEPGLYIQPDDQLFPAEYRGIGVRIEDDVLVTKNGAQILSRGIPSHPDEVEVWVANLLR
jgi:Xaa-Pro aminopeptidase